MRREPEIRAIIEGVYIGQAKMKGGDPTLDSQLAKSVVLLIYADRFILPLYL
jgi:hypothetical protein